MFIIGPILITVLATLIDPAIGLGSPTVIGVVGSLAFAAARHRAAAAPARPHPSAGADAVAHAGAARRVRFALGILFGAAEVTTVAFADEHDAKPWPARCSHCGRWAACSRA